MTTGTFTYKYPKNAPDKLTPQEKKTLSVDALMEPVLAKYRNHITPGLINEKGKIKHLYTKTGANGEDRLGRVIAELNQVPDAISELEKVADARLKLDDSMNGYLTRPVKNARELVEDPNWLDTNGFTLKAWPSKTVDWDNEKEVETIYYKEMTDLITEMTGATHVFCSNHLSRETGKTGFNEARGPLAKIYFQVRGAALFVHNDFTEFYGEDIIQSILTGIPQTQGFGFIEAIQKAGITEQQMRSSQMIVINTWRPTNATKEEPCLRLPLAMADRRSVSRRALVNTRIGPPPGGSRIFKCEPDPEHDWWYYPKMTKDEVLLIKTYDSEENPYFPTLHTAFDDPTTPKDHPERRSVELRVLCLVPLKDGRKGRLATTDSAVMLGESKL